MTPRHLRLSIEDIIRPALVTSEQAAALLGIAAKTWHNKVAAGDVPFEPVGQLVVSGKLSFTIWQRREVERLAEQRHCSCSPTRFPTIGGVDVDAIERAGCPIHDVAAVSR